MIKNVLFDFWETLVTFDGDEAIIEMRKHRTNLFQKKLQEYGYNFDFDKVWQSIEKVRNYCEKIRRTSLNEINTKEVIKLILKELSIKKNQQIYSELVKIYSTSILSMNLKLQPSTNDVLNSIKKKGCKIGIISNTEHGKLEIQLLKKFSIYEYFDSFIFSSDVGIRKPSIKIFKKALALLNANPKESVYIGDWPEIDILGAKNAGLFAIYFKTREKPYPEFVPKADAYIEKMDQLPEAIFNI